MRALSVAACGLVAIACGAALLGWSYSREPSKANLSESDAISRRLEALPGVVRVDGGYARDLENPGSAIFSIRVRRGTNLAAVAAAAVKAVWRSSLDPISSMLVLVGPEDSATGSLERRVDLQLEKAELERRYGPRP